MSQTYKSGLNTISLSTQVLPAISLAHPFPHPANCSFCELRHPPPHQVAGPTVMKSAVRVWRWGGCFGGFPGGRMLYHEESEMHEFGSSSAR